MECIQRAVIVVMDGCRPDALRAADTPNIDALWKRGSYSWKAQTVYPSVSLPPHCSLFWGVRPEVHGVQSNQWPEDYRYGVPTLFDLCKEKELKTAMVHGWKPFNPIAKQGTVDVLDMSPHYLRDDLETARSCVRVIERDSPDLAFYHFNGVDHAGGAHGWMSDGQVKALEEGDRAVGWVMDALKRTGCFDQTMIAILADHGGHDHTHGSHDPRDMTIPWICVGPGIRSGYEIEEDVFICDTAATIACGLGMEGPSSWVGKPIREIFLEG